MMSAFPVIRQVTMPPQWCSGPLSLRTIYLLPISWGWAVGAVAGVGAWHVQLMTGQNGLVVPAKW